MKIQLTLAVLLGVVPIVHAASTQVGDLRLSSGVYTGGFTYFDPASGGDLTRAVVGAPVGINSNFIAVTQNSGDVSPDSGTDVGLQTFSSATQIRNLNRFASDQDGPGAGGGPQRVGAVQWTIDLLALYNAGVTDLNLMMVTGAFYSGRTMNIEDGSGIFIDTVPIPEPGVSLLGLLGTFALLRRRR